MMGYRTGQIFNRNAPDEVWHKGLIFKLKTALQDGRLLV
jgi:hypothetical protein